jgi:hypothetical protein
MSPPGRPKRWHTMLRRIFAAIDSWPSWVMVLVALTCLILAIWLLTGLHGSGLGEPVDRTNPGRFLWAVATPMAHRSTGAPPGAGRFEPGTR